MRINRYIVDSFFSLQMFGRILMFLVVPTCFLALVFPTFETALLYIILGFLFFCCVALPVYIIAMFQKCSVCEKRILTLPKGQRREEFIYSTSFWYEQFGELIQIMQAGKLPCHHCGKLHEYK
jgi:hypothetical protein